MGSTCDEADRMFHVLAQMDELIGCDTSPKDGEEGNGEEKKYI